MNKEERQIQQRLRLIKVWDYTRNTLNSACKEIEKFNGTNSVELEANITSLIRKGYSEPIRLTQTPTSGGGRPNQGKKKLSCKCLNPSGRGVCVMGACVNVTKDGWIITINI